MAQQAEQKIKIQPIKSNRDISNFIRFPWKVNANEPNWVPPLIVERKRILNFKKNPFFKLNPAEFFLAYKNGELVGRIAAILNKQHNEFHNDKAGFFGFLEAVNDKTVFEELLSTAKHWLRQHDCEMMLGPVNPSSNDEMGFLIDGFDSPPFFMMTYNPPYYNEIMQALGYEKARDFYSYYVDKKGIVIDEKLTRIRKAVLKRHPVTLRVGNKKKFNLELEIIREIYNDAWANHWGFVPMNSEEIKFMARGFKKIIDPELVLIIEYKGEPAGFALGLPNYNEVFMKLNGGKLLPFGWLKFLQHKNKTKGVRVITLGIKQKFQRLGFASLFYPEIVDRVFNRSYSHCELSWIMEDNLLMNRLARLLGARIYKTYRVYQIPL